MNLFSATYLVKKVYSLSETTIKKHKSSLKNDLESNMPLFHKKREEGMEIIKNTDLEKHHNFVVLDFGHRVRMNAFVKDDKVTLFKHKTIDRDTLPLMLVDKKTLAKFFGIKQKDATIQKLKASLDRLVKENHLEITQGKPFLVASKSKDLDMDIALENILVSGTEYWGENFQQIIKDFQDAQSNIEKLKYLTETTEGFLEKISKDIMDNFQENPYLKIQKGRESFTRESEERFIEELYETNMDIALEITKEGTGEERIKMLGQFPIEDVINPSKALSRLLEREYSQRQKYLSQFENEEEIGEEIKIQQRIIQ